METCLHKDSIADCRSPPKTSINTPSLPRSKSPLYDSPVSRDGCPHLRQWYKGSQAALGVSLPSPKPLMGPRLLPAPGIGVTGVTLGARTRSWFGSELMTLDVRRGFGGLSQQHSSPVTWYRRPGRVYRHRNTIRKDRCDIGTCKFLVKLKLPKGT